MVHKGLTAVGKLTKEGMNVEAVDLRTRVPPDIDSIARSVKKTLRLLIAHSVMKRRGVASEIVLRVIQAASELMKILKGPIKRLANPNIALPKGAELESMLLPQIDDIVNAVR